MKLTLEEQETLAYMSGDTEKAKLLAMLIDHEADIDEHFLHMERKQAYNIGYSMGYGDGQRSMM